MTTPNPENADQQILDHNEEINIDNSLPNDTNDSFHPECDVIEEIMEKDGEEDEEEEDEEEEEEDFMKRPVKHIPIQYCQICGCPPCYCKFFGGHDPDEEEEENVEIQVNQNNENKENQNTENKENQTIENKEVVNKEKPNLFPTFDELSGSSNIINTNTSTLVAPTTEEKALTPAQQKRLLREQQNNQIIITIKSRTTRKSFTSICHLEKFNINVPDFMFLVSKKLATNCSFKTSSTGNLVKISGEVSADLIYLLKNEYKIDPSNIIVQRKLRKNAIIKNSVSRLEKQEKEKKAKEAALALEKAKIKPKPEIKGPRPKPGTKKAQALAKKGKK